MNDFWDTHNRFLSQKVVFDHLTFIKSIDRLSIFLVLKFWATQMLNLRHGSSGTKSLILKSHS
jgi:hypothetical protein